MEKIKLNETFSGTVTFTEHDPLCESGEYTSLIDGKNIIGLVEGQFFQPDGMSRNKRWYSRELWEKALASADVKSRLANRTMYGEIGHSDGPVTDMTLRDGAVSHIIADLWIDEKGRGMGRAYILDTPKGRLLKTYLGAKSKLKVSTRGEGAYLDGQYHDGCPVIDPDTYELQTVDFVLNPGFLETSAKLTTKQENFTPITQKQVNETKKEGESRMNVDDYIAELKEELRAVKAKNESLSEELKSKDKELLQSKFVESAEVKKISEAYAPFKKMGVSAQRLNETLKKAQNSLQKANDENVKLTEELQAYKDKCGSLKEVDEALEMSNRALDTISEYRQLGTVEEIKELMSKSEALVPQLEQLSVLTEYKKLGSVEDIKALVEKCEKSLPKLKEMPILEDYRKLGTIEEIKELSKKCESALPKLQQLSALKEYKKLGSVEELTALAEKCESAIPRLKELSVLEEYKKLGSIEDIKKLSAKAEAMLPKLAQLKDAKKLAESVKKVLPKLKEMKSLEETATKAHEVIQQYLETVGSIKKAKSLVEARKETIKKVSVKEAVEVSRKYGCTVESAAKLLNKYGVKKASALLEAAATAEKPAEDKKAEVLTESKKLVEDAAEIVEPAKVNAAPKDKSAGDFLKDGMLKHSYNLEALGKPLGAIELNNLNGDKVEGENQAKELLKKLQCAEPAVEDAPKVEPEKTPEEAEKEAEKLIK